MDVPSIIRAADFRTRRTGTISQDYGMHPARPKIQSQHDLSRCMGTLSCLSCNFAKGKQLQYLPVCFAGFGSPSKMGLHFKKGICSKGSKFFPLREDWNQKK